MECGFSEYCFAGEQRVGNRGRQMRCPFVMDIVSIRERDEKSGIGDASFLRESFSLREVLWTGNGAGQAHESFVPAAILCSFQLLPHNLTLGAAALGRRLLQPEGQLFCKTYGDRMTHD